MGKKYISAILFILCILIIGVFQVLKVKPDEIIFETYVAEYSKGKAKKHYSSIENFINDPAVIVITGGYKNPKLPPAGKFETAIFYPNPTEKTPNSIEGASYGFSRTGQIRGRLSGSEHIDLGHSNSNYYRGLFHRRKYGELDENRYWESSFDKGDIVIGDTHWKIPEEYIRSPHYRQNLGVSGSFISISAAAPDFLPVPQDKRQLHSSLQVRDRNWINGLGKGVIDVTYTNKIGDLTFVQNGKTGADWYYKIDDNENISTIVACYDSRKAETACQHRFYREGMMFNFDHSRELIHSSSAMEDAFFNLMRSFEVKH